MYLAPDNLQVSSPLSIQDVFCFRVIHKPLWLNQPVSETWSPISTSYLIDSVQWFLRLKDAPFQEQHYTHPKQPTDLTRCSMVPATNFWSMDDTVKERACCGCFLQECLVSNLVHRLSNGAEVKVQWRFLIQKTTGMAVLSLSRLSCICMRKWLASKPNQKIWFKRLIGCGMTVLWIVTNRDTNGAQSIHPQRHLGLSEFSICSTNEILTVISKQIIVGTETVS